MNAEIQEMSNMFFALGHPTRLDLIVVLSTSGPSRIQRLVETCHGGKFSGIYHHLRYLKGVGLVRTYTLPGSKAIHVLASKDRLRRMIRFLEALERGEIYIERRAK